MKQIVVAGGCFWGVQEYYRRLKGIIETEVGFAQGKTVEPSYKDVKSQATGHAECVRIVYDENVISLKQILDHLFRIIDPTSLNRQGDDIGTSYRTGIYPENSEDEATARGFVKEMQSRYIRPIVTEVCLLKEFYAAEDYHQNYLQNNPDGYCHIDFSLIRPEEMK